LQHNSSLTFFIKRNNIQEPFTVKWKIRNYWAEAEAKDWLRWEIHNDTWNKQRKENTSYYGDHIVECFVIQKNICVAKDLIKVPITNY
jgi:hypothetical protein